MGQVFTIPELDPDPSYKVQNINLYMSPIQSEFKFIFFLNFSNHLNFATYSTHIWLNHFIIIFISIKIK